MKNVSLCEGSTTDTNQALRKAFYAALLLTGDIALAERAVTNGISDLDLNHSLTKNLRMPTIEYALRHSQHASPHSPQLMSLLPSELQRVVLLPLFLRHCFVLRILLGVTSENCAKILHRSVSEIDEAVRRAILMLASGGRYSPERTELQFAKRTGDDYVGGYSLRFRFGATWSKTSGHPV